MAPLANNVPCSGLTLALNLDDKIEHDEADASCMFWLRRTSTAAQWIDFAFKRIIYVNYPDVYLNTARIRYLGDLAGPAVRTFEGP